MDYAYGFGLFDSIGYNGNLRKEQMMEARELMIGNWIEFNGLQYKIESISNLEIVSFNYPDTKRRIVKHINPIPLTEEWLIRFGYMPCNFRESHFVTKGHTIWICNELFLCDKNGIVLKYVHQLQNLYHALTGTELELK